MNPERARERLYGLLGDLPARQRKITTRKVGESEGAGYRMERLLLDLNGHDPVPALFVVPRTGKGPFPAVLFHHSHGGRHHVGKRELIEGNEYLVQPPHAEALAERGFASLCIDQLNFGERHRSSESELYKELLWYGKSLWGMMVYDSLRSLDYLATRREVDASRIGSMGISMGSTLSWWTAALDERIAAVVELCCLTDYEELIASRGLDRHGIYYYVPGLLKHFDTSQIVELIAPRPFLSMSGNQDPLTPPRGLDKINAHLKQVYKQKNATSAWQMLREEHGHFETHSMRYASLEWLTKWLGKALVLGPKSNHRFESWASKRIGREE